MPVIYVLANTFVPVITLPGPNHPYETAEIVSVVPDITPTKTPVITDDGGPSACTTREL
jgi:hypothetical protein